MAYNSLRLSFEKKIKKGRHVAKTSETPVSPRNTPSQWDGQSINMLFVLQISYHLFRLIIFMDISWKGGESFRSS